MATPTRRDLLRGLVTLPLIKLPGVFPPKGNYPAHVASPPDIPTQVKDTATAELYRGYAIFWTGWKGGMYDAHLLGQWLAWPPSPNAAKTYGQKAYIFTSVPWGVTGFYRKGDQFMCVPQRERVPHDLPAFCSFETSEDARLAMILDGKAQMLAFIDREGHRG